jgi:type IV secretion system protein VirB8
MTPDKATYYPDATGWASSASDAARRSRNLAWMVAGGMGLVAIFEALALTSLAPLKSVKVVPVLVDRQTGFVEVLREDGQVAIRPDASLTRAMLAQYVLAREGFNITTVGAEYRKVMLWSSGPARTSYATLMPAQNPDSPLKIYPRSTIVDGTIESVSDLSPNTALVRFTTRRRDGDGQPGPPNYYAAVVTYQRDDEVAPPEAPLHSRVDVYPAARDGSQIGTGTGAPSPDPRRQRRPE